MFEHVLAVAISSGRVARSNVGLTVHTRHQHGRHVDLGASCNHAGLGTNCASHTRWACASSVA